MKEGIPLYTFQNDYSEGCHPAVLEALTRTNYDHTSGYGTDPYCERARALIREAFRCPGADVHFLTGGTQVNQTAIAAFLRPWEAAVCTNLGHIAVHETGAIEATGHKVVTCPSEDGILTPEMVRTAVAAHPDEHMVKPKLVYISNSTEVGTIYTKAQLSALRKTCDELGLYLYLDGARLGSALASKENDLSPADLPALCDAFYIGGTKNGALFGEALVIVNDALKPDFRYGVKQRGGMLAKGRLLGVQFEALFAGGFEDSAWLSIGRYENGLAQKLQDGIVKAGYPLLVRSPSNQVFPIFPDKLVEKLAGEFKFEVQRRFPDGQTCIRLVTSWATEEAAVAAFLKEI